MVALLRRVKTWRRVNTVSLKGFETSRNISSIAIGCSDISINPVLTADEMKLGTRLGVDSHADTSCINKHAYIESIIEGMTVDAIPFDDAIGKMTNLPIVNGIYAYDDESTFRTILLRINNAIYIKDMKHALLCPNQARENGVIIDDIPHHLDHTGTSTFSIDVGEYNLPLHRHGPTAYVPLRRPTEDELNHCSIVDITEEEEWDPYKNSHVYAVNSISTHSAPIDDIDDWLLYSTDRNIGALQMTKPKDKLTPEYLSQIWKCGLETARKTIEATTCLHYRQTLDGVTKRFKPTRSLRRYKQLTLPAGEFYTDTMFSKVRSTRGSTCAQIYGNKFGFIKSYPMDKNDQQNVGDTLSLIVQEAGVMQKLHTDNAPEMVGRKIPFFKRARKEGIDLTTIEPK